MSLGLGCQNRSPLTHQFQSGGGGAVGTRGTITVNKVDKDKNNIKLIIEAIKNN